MASKCSSKMHRKASKSAALNCFPGKNESRASPDTHPGTYQANLQRQILAEDDDDEMCAGVRKERKGVPFSW